MRPVAISTVHTCLIDDTVINNCNCVNRRLLINLLVHCVVNNVPLPSSTLRARSGTV